MDAAGRHAGLRDAHGCVAPSKLYAVGGRGANYQQLDTAEVYDPQAEAWQPLPKMRTARGALGLAAVGKIYAIVAMLRSALDSVEAYDPRLGAWARWQHEWEARAPCFGGA